MTVHAPPTTKTLVAGQWACLAAPPLPKTTFKPLSDKKKRARIRPLLGKTSAGSPGSVGGITQCFHPEQSSFAGNVGPSLPGKARGLCPYRCPVSCLGILACPCLAHTGWFCPCCRRSRAESKQLSGFLLRLGCTPFPPLFHTCSLSVSVLQRQRGLHLVTI